MVSQISFEDVDIAEKVARAKGLGCEWEKRLKAVALSIDRKLLAAYLDVSYSYLSEILNTNNENGQKPWPTKFTGALLMLAPDVFMAELINPFCDMSGYKHPEKKSPLTPEEELAALKKVIREKGLEKIFYE